jgi:hypothetical protein
MVVVLLGYDAQYPEDQNMCLDHPENLKSYAHSLHFLQLYDMSCYYHCFFFLILQTKLKYEGWNFNSGNTAVETPRNGTK